jgi:hypothetical protein
MKNIITALGVAFLFYFILAVTNNVEASSLKMLLGSNNPAKLELVVYENGCFDIRQKNIYLLRCA